MLKLGLIIPESAVIFPQDFMSSFTLKQFHINQQHCAMKVGTDGILLGAWRMCLIVSEFLIWELAQAWLH